MNKQGGLNNTMENTELIAELQGIYPLNDYEFQNAMSNNFRGFQDMCGEAADALEAADKRVNELEAAQRWIPVGERLPEPETNVLICQHYHEDAPYAKITIGHLHQDRDLRHKPYWNWIAHGADMVHPKIEAYHRAEFICPGKEFVTHWMPLPAAPSRRIRKE
jgi:hypothetical protein